VSKSVMTAEIDTFINEVSTTRTNIAAASRIISRRLPAAGGSPPVTPSELVSPKATERLPALSTREREILGLLANGFSNPEIASRLFISPETVRTHVRNAMTKLEADTRTQAVALALRYALID